MSSDLVRARRALLRTPLIVDDLDHDSYALVVSNLSAVRQWFDDECSWKVDHDRADRTVRLFKVHADPPAAAPMTAPDVTVTPRRICLALVAAAHIADQGAASIMTAAALRDRVVETCNSHDDLPDLDLASDQTDRRDLTAAFRWLNDAVGAFEVIDGDLADAVATEDGNALLRIRTSVCAMLLTTDPPSDPSTPVHQVRETLQPASVEGRERQLRTGAVRTLLDRPALYRDTFDYDDLPPTARGRLTVQLRRVAVDVDLHVEQRSEGWAAIDTVPQQPLSTVAFPYRSSTAAHCALLLAEHAASLARTGTSTITTRQLQTRTRGLIDTYAHRARWAASLRDSPATLTAEALALLVAHDLLVPAADPGVWTITPLCGRYAPLPATSAPDDGNGSQSTLDLTGTEDA